MKVAFDSNVMVYLARIWRGGGDQAKTDVADMLLLRLPASLAVVLPFQVLGEAYHVMRRHGYAHEKCRSIVLAWTENFDMADSSSTAFANAVDLATEHKLQFWDALIISIAADAGCNLLLSEDLQAGFTWRGVTVVNPFADPLDPRLAKLLDAAE